MLRTIFLIDDDPAVQRLLGHAITQRLGHTVRSFTSGEEALEAIGVAPVDLAIIDVVMPGIGGIELLRELLTRRPTLPVILLSGQNDIEVAVSALKEGAVDYLPKSVDMPRLELAIGRALELGELRAEVSRLREAVGEPAPPDGIVTVARSMQEVLRLVRKAGESDISVLIQGESGTGKELIARAVHFGGKRKEGPFVAVNCAAIPGELLESEMFGHEKGAFTGAVARKIGRFEQADGGTIFLDEIGELDPNLQAKLLRAIQLRQFERVGSSELITVDVRIISATNRDLLAGGRDGSFREDLYYRLGSFPIHLPALRERPEDILPIAEHFLRRYAEEQSSPARRFSRDAARLLLDYAWPGNVRELESAVQRGALLAESEEVEVHDLPMAVRTVAVKRNEGEEGILPMEKVKERAVRQALRATDGNIVEAARALGISRSTLYEMMKKYGV